MSIPLYMDVHVHGAVTKALSKRGVDVLTAQDDGRGDKSDPMLLDRATALQRTLVTYDADFLAIASRRQLDGVEFAGIIHAHPLSITIGQLIEQLHFVCEAVDMAYMQNRVERLPY